MARMTGKELDDLEEEIREAVNSTCGLILGGSVDREGEWDNRKTHIHMLRIQKGDGREWEMEPDEFRNYVRGLTDMAEHLQGRQHHCAPCDMRACGDLDRPNPLSEAP